MKSPLIQTDKYLLRPFRTEDAELWQVWDVDPEVQVHMPEPANEPQDIARQYEYIKECETDEEGWYWSIETNEGETIGTVSLFEFDPHHKTANIGFVIGNKDYWGKGAATQVGRAVVEHAFRDLQVERISAEVEEANVPMRKVLEKIGFENDGLFRSARMKNGKRIGVMHFGILKS